MRLAVLIIIAFAPFLVANAEYPPSVVWDSPSAGPEGSMPLGNGDIGLNAWVEADGDLLFYIAKTDAWSENARLLKLGRIRVALSPNPFRAGLPFVQTLDTATGIMRVVAGTPESKTTLELWVDAHNPAVRFQAESETPVEIRVTVESWRTEPRNLRDVERHSAYGLANSGAPIVVEPDTFLEEAGNELIWFHRNDRSVYDLVMRNQEVEEWLSHGRDQVTLAPWVNRRDRASTMAAISHMESTRRYRAW